MDYVWTPWRYQYLKQVESGALPECFFCDAIHRKDDHATLVVYRGKKVSSSSIVFHTPPATS